MPQLNLKDRTLEARLVYLGSSRDGCRSDLAHLQGVFPDGRGADTVIRQVGAGRLLSVRWTPSNLEQFNGCEVAVDVVGLEGDAPTAEERRALLQGADGIVVVLDGGEGALERNRQMLEVLRRDCALAGVALERVPVVVQIDEGHAPSDLAPGDLLGPVGAARWQQVQEPAHTAAGVVGAVREATVLISRALRQPGGEPKTAPVPARARFDAVDRELESVRSAQAALASRQAALESIVSTLGPRIEEVVTEAIARLSETGARRAGEVVTQASAQLAALDERLSEVADQVRAVRLGLDSGFESLNGSR